MSEMLVTLAEYKAFMGVSTAPGPHDTSYEFAIRAASQLVRSYTGLRLEINDPTAPPTTRLFRYDGSGFLDIDECQAISDVAVSVNYPGVDPVSIPNHHWMRHPLNGPVAYWLEMTVNGFGGISPQMGFTYNLDTLWHTYPKQPVLVSITATWGWTEIPFDIKQAVLWASANAAKTANPYYQESIENYSRTRVMAEIEDALPPRTMSALDPYIIPHIA